MAHAFCAIGLHFWFRRECFGAILVTFKCFKNPKSPVILLIVMLHGYYSLKVKIASFCTVSFYQHFNFLFFFLIMNMKLEQFNLYGKFDKKGGYLNVFLFF